MALTDAERDWVKELVANVSRTTAEQMVDRMLAAHVAACPYGQRLMKYCCLGVGLALGAGLLSDSIWSTINALLGGVIP